MKIKIAVTAGLLALLTGVSLITLRSFEGLNLKLQMGEPSQVTMEMLPVMRKTIRLRSEERRVGKEC